jgi:hypothetical protein
MATGVPGHARHVNPPSARHPSPAYFCGGGVRGVTLRMAITGFITYVPLPV